MFDLSKATVRAALKPRPEPYWHRLGAGRHLGLRRLRNDSWIARYRPPQGDGYTFRALADAVDFDSAVKAAHEWYEARGAGSARVITVEQACRRYAEGLKSSKSARRAGQAEGYLRRRVYGTAFGARPLDRVRAAEIRAWRDAMLATLARASANRTLKQLKAALSAAFRDGLVPSDAAWRAVGGFPGADEPRMNYLPLKTRRALVRQAPADLRQIIEGMLHTAARPVELHRATRADLDLPHRSIRLTSYKGRGSTKRVREVPLTDAALKFFARLANGKSPGAPLFICATGRPWVEERRSEAFRELRQALGLADDIDLYDIRHTVVTEWLKGGVDPATVAKVAGTSLAMITTHYAKLLHGHAVRALGRVRTL
jgi:integrase